MFNRIINVQNLFFLLLGTYFKCHRKIRIRWIRIAVFIELPPLSKLEVGNS